MRKILHGFLMGGIVLLAAEGLYAQNQYVGVKMCSPCHKTAKQGTKFDVWQKSRHSGAYKTLTTPKANEIAKAKGFSTAAAEPKE